MNQPNQFQQKSQQKPQNQQFQYHDNVIETLRDTANTVGKDIKNSLLDEPLNDTLGSLFGSYQSGEQAKNPFEKFFPGQQKEQPASTPHRSEVLSPQRLTQEQQMVQQQIQAIRMELVQLAQELSELDKEVEHAIAEVPINPGIYHLNFFERLRNVIHLLRKNVHDSNTWASLAVSKKKQKGYWGLYKKHGTQFGLSADRTPATQTG
jgi:hypothetical protein